MLLGNFSITLKNVLFFVCAIIGKAEIKPKQKSPKRFVLVSVCVKLTAKVGETTILAVNSLPSKGEDKTMESWKLQVV